MWPPNFHLISNFNIRKMEQRMMIRLMRKMEPRMMMRHLQGIRSRWEFVVVSGGNPGGVVYQPGVPHHTTPRHATPHLVHARDVESADTTSLRATPYRR